MDRGSALSGTGRAEVSPSRFLRAAPAGLASKRAAIGGEKVGLPCHAASEAVSTKMGREMSRSP
jgi:hypothetical protein